MLNKKCSHCKEIKPVNEFFKDSRRKDGLYCNCKICHTEYTIQYSKTEKAKKVAKEHRKKYSKTPQAKLLRNITQREYRIKNSLRARARGAVHNATQRGQLPRVTTLLCIKCSKPAQAYHHHNGYEHKLDVIPVCLPCHHIIHMDDFKHT